MITDSFDTSDVFISPEKLYPQSSETLDVCIGIFSHKVMNELITSGDLTELPMEKMPGSASGKHAVYRYKDTTIGIYQNEVGAVGASGLIEEISVIFGVKKFIIFGSCGALVQIPEGDCIIPTHAYRDEGVSYHYAPASDYISVKNASVIAKLFDKLGVEYIFGKTWTTDCFYRETVNQKNKRVEEGCICVEMECAALQAVTDFRGYELYQFLYTADDLSKLEWAPRILGDNESNARFLYFDIAVKLAKSLL